MKVIGISMVKNEADVIEAFVRFNLQYLDVMVIMDNLSSDYTRKILDLLVDEGLPIVIFDDPIIRYIQSSKMTGLMNKVLETYNPDYIVPIDADEFLYVPANLDFRQALIEIPDGRVGRLPMANYEYTGSEEVYGNILQTMRIRSEWFGGSNTKIIIPGKLAKEQALTISMGNHVALTPGRKVVPSIDLPVKTAHFPLRNPEQICSKFLLGWISYLADAQRIPGWFGVHWESAYKKILGSNDANDSDLFKRVAETYQVPADKPGLVEDMIPNANQITIKYPHLRQSSLMLKTIKVSEELARQLSTAEGKLLMIKAVLENRGNTDPAEIIKQVAAIL